MRKHNFETYEEFLKFQKKKAADWYLNNRERKMEYQRNYYYNKKLENQEKIESKEK